MVKLCLLEIDVLMYKHFSALYDDGWLCHRRLRHASMDLISNISKNDLVKGLPKIDFQKDRIC